MANLAIHQPDARSGARLSAALSEAHRLVSFPSWLDLVDGVSAGDLEGALVDADHPSPDAAIARLRHLRSLYPDLTLVGFTERTRPKEYYRLGMAGLEAFIGDRDGPLATRTAVDDALARRRGRVVQQALRPHLSSPGPEAIGWALARAGDAVDVEALARALGFSAYGLRGILHERALPAPSVLLLWGRLLAAAGRLHGDGRKVEETAFALGYASAPSLARALRNHVGLTPREVAEGSFSSVLGRLVSRIRGFESPPIFNPHIIPAAVAPQPPRRR